MIARFLLLVIVAVAGLRAVALVWSGGSAAEAKQAAGIAAVALLIMLPLDVRQRRKEGW